jgi:hypothetical protein
MVRVPLDLPLASRAAATTNGNLISSNSAAARHDNMAIPAESYERYKHRHRAESQPKDAAIFYGRHRHRYGKCALEVKED